MLLVSGLLVEVSSRPSSSGSQVPTHLPS